MLKNYGNDLKNPVCLSVLAWLMFSIGQPTIGIGQQSSAAVTAKIDQSNETLAKRKPSISSMGVVEVPEGFEKLKLQPGYLLQMDIYNVPEMSAELRIDTQGAITIPLVGPVHVAGETFPQAQDAIRSALIDKEILKNPQVTLNILQFSSTNISVLGEVQSPGRIQLLAPEPLGDVIALAGGETIAAADDIEIEHHSGDGEVLTTRHVKYVQGEDSAVLRSVTVEPGDTVLVHRAGIIYVVGAVNRPGGYLMVNSGSLNVIQAISLAEGTTIQASTRWAVVVRRQGDGFVQFKVPISKMETGAAAPIQLQLNDTLFIPLSTWKAVLVNGSNVLSAATSASIYRAP
jgi:polysaccharide export outer membrane protein